MSERKPGLHTGGWFDQQTDEEIQRHIDGGGPGNKFYEAAVRVRDRRAADREAREQLRWIKITLLATIILGLGAIAATFLA